MRAVLHWMARHFGLAWLLVLAWPTYWSFDRKPPLSVNGYVTVTQILPGNTALIEIPVIRETWRNCSTQFRKRLVDSQDEEFEYGIEQLISAASLVEMEKRTGPWIKTSIHIPDTAHAGIATLVIDAAFICNPLHKLWPIERTLYIPLAILPPT